MSPNTFEPNKSTCYIKMGEHWEISFLNTSITWHLIGIKKTRHDIKRSVQCILFVSSFHIFLEDLLILSNVLDIWHSTLTYRLDSGTACFLFRSCTWLLHKNLMFHCGTRTLISLHSFLLLTRMIAFLFNIFGFGSFMSS